MTVLIVVAGASRRLPSTCRGVSGGSTRAYGEEDEDEDEDVDEDEEEDIGEVDDDDMMYAAAISFLAAC